MTFPRSSGVRPTLKPKWLTLDIQICGFSNPSSTSGRASMPEPHHLTDVISISLRDTTEICDTFIGETSAFYTKRKHYVHLLFQQWNKNDTWKKSLKFITPCCKISDAQQTCLQNSRVFCFSAMSMFWMLTIDFWNKLCSHKEQQYISFSRSTQEEMFVCWTSSLRQGDSEALNCRYSPTTPQISPGRWCVVCCSLSPEVEWLEREITRSSCSTWPCCAVGVCFPGSS